jgi:hypothetical protein
VGQPPPDGVYHPLRDLSLTLKERGEAFVPWVSYYFEPIATLEEVTLSILAMRRGIHEQSLSADIAKVPTVYQMTAEELNSVLDRDVLERSSATVIRVSRDIYSQNVERSLLHTQGILPDVKILLVWADESMHDCIWAAKLISEMAVNVGPDGRKIEVERLCGANHFVSAVCSGVNLSLMLEQAHWDMPESIVEMLSKRI